MKKLLALLLALALLGLVASCGAVSETPEPSSTSASAPEEKWDVDLTALSATMVYSEVYNMMTAPADYEGKSVKMRGQFALFYATDSAGNILSDQIYYACVIADATACCQQGLEFLPTGLKYPDDFPPENSEITVTGVFETYMEGQNQYCHLTDAKMTVEKEYADQSTTPLS